MVKKTTLLCILDGFGHSEETEFNAIHHAQTPNWDRISSAYPKSLLHASGEYVGLPDGQAGNSEVGHLNIGAGRVVLQLLPKINRHVKNDTLKDKTLLNQFIKKLQDSGGACHLLGILSKGGVHGHEDHIIYLAKYISSKGVKVCLHAFLDGRDVLPKSANESVKSFLAQTRNDPNIILSSICGRYYAMDRDNNWDRTEKSYRAIAEAKSDTSENFIDLIENQYREDITDEFVKPHICPEYSGVKPEDGFLITNYRADRARQIITAFLDKNFAEFPRKNIEFFSQIGMAEYSTEIHEFLPSLFPTEIPQNILADVLEKNNLKQLHIAETEKYAHVTFFFNGGVEKEKEGENRILFPSPNVKTYDLQPEMSAPEITKSLLEEIKKQEYDFIVVNFANPDMVGHTGKWEAAIKAVSQIDKSIGELEKAILEIDGNILITADHGNIECMFDKENNQEFTAHTLNQVPFVLINKGSKFTLKDGQLCDIAPTILRLMNIDQPKEMTGIPLL